PAGLKRQTRLAVAKAAWRADLGNLDELFELDQGSDDFHELGDWYCPPIAHDQHFDFQPNTRFTRGYREGVGAEVLEKEVFVEPRLAHLICPSRRRPRRLAPGGAPLIWEIPAVRLRPNVTQAKPCWAVMR